jgi:hypothetical protein
MSSINSNIRKSNSRLRRLALGYSNYGHADSKTPDVTTATNSGHCGSVRYERDGIDNNDPARFIYVG